jgi:hypothetical protein
LFSFVPRVKRLRPHPRQAKASTSFLKKKKQKTFNSCRGFYVAGRAPYLSAGAGHKSLLVLFFRKEHAFPLRHAAIAITLRK